MGECEGSSRWVIGRGIQALTDELVREAGALIDEIEEMGGMAVAVASGLPKTRIEQSATRKQVSSPSLDGHFERKRVFVQHMRWIYEQMVVVGANRFGLGCDCRGQQVRTLARLASISKQPSLAVSLFKSFETTDHVSI